MSAIKNLTEKIKSQFYAFPPASNEEINIAEKRGVPKILLDFYRECNGCFIGIGEEYQAPNGKEYQFKILRLSEVKNVQEFEFIEEDTPLFSTSKEWWQFATIGGDNFYALDNNNGSEKILDIPHEEVGYEDCHAIIANSITELIQKLIANNGQDWFADDDWNEIGRV